MTSSLKVARLDFFTMKSQLKLCLMLAFITVYFTVIGSSMVTLCFTSAWFVALIVSNLFVIQEKNNLGKLYSSLSLRSRDIVLGRYLFMFFCHLLSNVMVIVIYYICTVFNHAAMESRDVMAGLCLSLLAFSVIVGIQTPLFFKMGYTKAKIWAMLPFIAVMGLAVIPSFIPDVSSTVGWIQAADTSVLVAGSPILSCMVLGVSCFLSIGNYRNQR